jgi:hypothetical protein
MAFWVKGSGTALQERCLYFTLRRNGATLAQSFRYMQFFEAARRKSKTFLKGILSRDDYFLFEGL